MAKLGYPGTGNNSPAARAQRETHWRRVVERWKASGLTKSVFCEREGLSTAVLHWWIRELERRDGTSGSSRPRRRTRTSRVPRSFVPVRVVASEAARGGSIEILVDGHVLRVAAGFDPEDLRRVLSVLEGRAC